MACSRFRCVAIYKSLSDCSPFDQKNECNFQKLLDLFFLHHSLARLLARNSFSASHCMKKDLRVFFPSLCVLFQTKENSQNVWLAWVHLYQGIISFACVLIKIKLVGGLFFYSFLLLLSLMLLMLFLLFYFCLRTAILSHKMYLNDANYPFKFSDKENFNT